MPISANAIKYRDLGSGGDESRFVKDIYDLNISRGWGLSIREDDSWNDVLLQLQLIDSISIAIYQTTDEITINLSGRSKVEAQVDETTLELGGAVELTITEDFTSPRISNAQYAASDDVSQITLEQP